MEIFSERWAIACCERLNEDESYRRAAAGWEWPVVLILEEGDEAERRIFLDLWRGACRGARLASEEDMAAAAFVIRASSDTWRSVLTEELDPVLGLLRGKLSLDKGGLVKLARYADAARKMVAAATRVTQTLPAVEVPPPRDATTPQAESVATAAGPRGLARTGFATTAARGLDHDSLPMRLYHKAKVLGTWNPRDIDFSIDRGDWEGLDPLERQVIIHLTSLFQAGEESVTLDLLPLMLVIAREGRLEEEMYLSTFLWEEAKHTEFFRRFLDEVAETYADLSRFHGPDYRRIFYEELPAAMGALLADSSPRAQVRASVTYNMIVEGTLAETGYHAYGAMLERNGLLPGLLDGIGKLRRDESRHIAYGIFLLSRIVAAQPTLWAVLEERMRTLIDPALGIIHELFDAYESMPFGLTIEEFLDYATAQFEKRLARIERARDGDPEELTEGI